MTKFYKPTDEEVEDVASNFLLVADQVPNTFTIGRLDAGYVAKLHQRYPEAENIYVLYQGSPGKAAWLERSLINYCWQKYPLRCLNEQSGGGPQGEGTTHIVYLVLWPDTSLYMKKGLRAAFMRSAVSSNF